ncbi:MAG: alkaline phosphatase family protein [Nitrospirae bacterium]|nr:alkaline phosphatase family protein [Nitrospirota bacterium]
MNTLLIGLDGTPWSILHKWMKAGHLPAIKKIYDNSARGTLQSTIPTYTCPALPTLFTGKSQGETGVFGFTYPDGTPVSLRTMKDFKLWNILSKNDKESCIVNVRMLYPVEELKGIMISGNPAPSEESDYVYPRELKPRVFGFRQVEDDLLSEELTIDPQKNRDTILNLRIKITKHRYKVFKELNAEKKYDFSFFWVGGTDFMGHWFWDDEDTYLRYFKEVDLIITDILETFQGWNILIISDHGMQGIQKKKFYVNTWLEKNGYLKYKGNIISSFARKMLAPQISTLLSMENKQRILRLLRRNNNSQKEAVMTSAVVTESEVVARLEYGKIHNIDWEKTKAYLVNDWGIVVKSNPHSREYEAIRNDIVEKMKNLIDDEGGKIVKDVWRKEAIFKGKYLEQIPDIVFISTEDYGMSILPSVNITNKLSKDHVARGGGRYFRGDHEGAIEGILMAYGPDVQPGDLTVKAGLMDIMPTVLHMLDVEVPDDVDGVVLKELFKKDTGVYCREVRKKDYGSPSSQSGALSDEENEEIIGQLKKMGYM